jgi:allantoinase
VPEFTHVGQKDLIAALPLLRRRRLPLLVHAEWPASLRMISVAADPREYATWLDSRPETAECDAIALLIALAREFDAHVHIVHVASAAALRLLREARAEGLPITAETCPHYLTFSADEVRPGATEFKCAPPIRERENSERLWAALEEGVIDLVATDHSPCPPEMKAGDFASAWGGIASLQLSLGIMWNQARRRGIAAERLMEWMSAAPARLAGLGGRKGAIAPGYDADIVIWNPEGEPGALRHRHKLTPYRAAQFPGAVEATFLRGRKIYERGSLVGEPSGEILSGYRKE